MEEKYDNESFLKSFDFDEGLDFFKRLSEQLVKQAEQIAEDAFNVDDTEAAFDAHMNRTRLELMWNMTKLL